MKPIPEAFRESMERARYCRRYGFGAVSEAHPTPREWIAWLLAPWRRETRSLLSRLRAARAEERARFGVGR